MKKSSSVPQPAKPHTLSHDGRAIASIDGKTTFISGALPHEEIEFIYTKQRSRFDEGRLTQIITPSPDRIAPPCPHFGICGGCALQHMKVDAQIEYKQGIVLEQLRHFGKVTPKTILSPLTAEPLGYRRKARLGIRFVEKKNKLLIGFREQQSRYLADLETCEILDPRIGHRLPELRTALMKLEAYREIPQVEIAASANASSTHEVALVFRHMIPLSEQDQNHLIEFGRNQHYSIYLQGGGPHTIKKIYPDGPSFLIDTQPELGLKFEFHPTDFVQVNSKINAKMVPLALDLLALNSDDHILDLFCGLGNFSLPLAQQAKQVIGVEGSDIMVQRAKINAINNHLNNVNFYCADLTQDFTTQPWFSASINKVLLDPPRSGAQEIIAKFNHLSLERVVYVSCNPATLARDAGLLVHELGFELSTLGVIDMFPHTAHVETIALFKQN